MTPTPNDLARRARLSAPTAAPLAHGGRVDRIAYGRAIRDSRLHPHARLVALTLASLADLETGLIPDDQQPTLRGLGAATALGQGELLHSLRRLEEAGWLARRSAANGMRFVLATPPGRTAPLRS